MIFVSGYSADIAGKEFNIQAGEVFIQKPFESPVLLEKVRQCLDSWEGTKAGRLKFIL